MRKTDPNEKDEEEFSRWRDNISDIENRKIAATTLFQNLGQVLDDIENDVYLDLEFDSLLRKMYEQRCKMAQPTLNLEEKKNGGEEDSEA